MKHTKFIKVSTADRLPKKSGNYFVLFHSGNVNGGLIKGEKDYAIHSDRFTKSPFPIQYWLEEKPDYEEEMKEMIKELISELDPATLSGNYQEAIDKANLLLEQFTHCTKSNIGKEINLFNY